MKFVATCAAGFEQVVVELLNRETKSHINVLLAEDGLLYFSADLSPQIVKGLDYVNNSFQVLSTIQGTGRTGIDAILADLLRARDWMPAVKRATLGGRRTFRLVLSDENRLVSGNPSLLGQLISAVEGATRLVYRPRGGDTEFWVLRRRSGMAFFCLRLSQRSATERTLEKGQLRPELAELLCHLSEPTKRDIFMDPFAGNGGIVLTRLRHPYNMIFAFDSDENHVNQLKMNVRSKAQRARARGGPVIVRVEDARTLGSINDGFIDKIVSDPPWGLYDQTLGDLVAFYRGVIREMARVTKRGGIVVLLLARTEALEQVVAEIGDGFRQERRLDILVSGKKAMVVKWRRMIAQRELSSPQERSEVNATTTQSTPEPSQQ